MISGVVNPSVGKSTREVYQYLPCPKQKRRIAELEAEIESLKSNQQVREVVREVEKTVLKDEGLLEQLNAAHKELAALRGALKSRQPAPRNIVEIKPKVEIKEVEKIVEVVKLKYINRKSVIVKFSAAAFVAGSALTYLAHLWHLI
jgi:anion-transporting  ArsA/GET3 family ATPase